MSLDVIYHGDVPDSIPLIKDINSYGVTINMTEGASG